MAITATIVCLGRGKDGLDTLGDIYSHVSVIGKSGILRQIFLQISSCQMLCKNLLVLVARSIKIG